MSSEQPGGDGHALSPGPARRAARAEPPGPPPPRAPASHLGSSPARHPTARPGGGNAEEEAERAAGATWWGLEAARLAPTAFPRRLPGASQTQNPFKPALTKGSPPPVTPEAAPAHVTSSVQPGSRAAPGTRAALPRGAGGPGARAKCPRAVCAPKGQDSENHGATEPAGARPVLGGKLRPGGKALVYPEPEPQSRSPVWMLSPPVSRVPHARVELGAGDSCTWTGSLTY